MLTRFQLLIIVALILLVVVGVAARMARGQTPAPNPPRSPQEIHLPAQPVEVPLRDGGPLPAVEVEVNGQGPFLFWVDTGATGSARADVSLVEKLSLKAVGEVQVQDGLGQAGPPMQLVRIDSLRVGSAEFIGLEAATRDYNRQLPSGFAHIDGILGFHLFTDTLFTIDYVGKRLQIARGELPPVDGQEILALTAGGRGPRISLGIGGKTVEAEIDSGFQGMIQLPAEIAQPLLAGEPVVVGRARTVTGEFEIKEAPIAGTLKVGRHQLSNPRVTIAAVPGPLVLGSGFLRHFAITFDQRNGRVRFARKAEGAIEEQPRYRVGVAFAQAPGVQGLIAAEVFPGSAGEKAGLRKDDLVVKINGHPALEVPASELRNLFGSPAPIQLTIERAGKSLELELVPQREGAPARP